MRLPLQQLQERTLASLSFVTRLELGQRAEALNGPCTTGKKKGVRLDAWVLADDGAGAKVLYQVEVKNWSAHAIGGARLNLDAAPAKIAAHKIDRWQQQSDDASGTFRDESVAKVLVRMRAPQDCDLQEPVICYWWGVHPEGADEPLFQRQIRDHWCTRVWIFSMSSYLRVSTRPVSVE